MTHKVEVETVDALRRRLEVEVPADEVAAEIDKAFVELGRAAKIPGFRPGRVPRPVLERLFGDRVRAEVFATLIQHSYAEVLDEHKIEALGQPEIVTEQAKPGGALRYSATVEVKPELSVDGYNGLTAERPVAPVTDADVDAFLARLQHSFAQLRPIPDRTRPQQGDVVALDYEARVEARVVSRGEGRDIEVGANGFPPEFDAHLLAASVGDEVAFAVTYPTEHEATQLAGKTVAFRVRLHALSRKEIPPLDDEFAKDHGECATLAELRQRVRQRLEEEADHRADQAVREALLTQLAAAHDIPIPKALVERRTEALVQEVLDEWRQQRVRPRDESQALAQLRSELEPRARQQVRMALLLEAIARQEGLAVSAPEIEQRIESLAAAAGAAAERVRALYQDPEARRQLETRMLQTRAVDIVVQRAKLTTVESASNIAEVVENG